MNGFFESAIFTYAVVPVLIVFARICDVTIGTLRIIMLSRGHKYLAPFFGFFEVLIWVTVTAKIMQNLHNPVCYIAYAGGFAIGNFIGIIIEERLAMGTLVIRVITSREASGLTADLRERGFGATSIPAEGSSGPVNVIFTVIKRSALKDVVEIIKQFNPRAFYSVEDVRYVSEGVFPLKKSLYECNGLGLGQAMRKGK
jgi:uncharacterized protein YebE (UPF0316 family)